MRSHLHRDKKEDEAEAAREAAEREAADPGYHGQGGSDLVRSFSTALSFQQDPGRSGSSPPRKRPRVVHEEVPDDDEGAVRIYGTPYTHSSHSSHDPPSSPASVASTEIDLAPEDMDLLAASEPSSDVSMSPEDWFNPRDLTLSIRSDSAEPSELDVDEFYIDDDPLYAGNDDIFPEAGPRPSLPDMPSPSPSDDEDAEGSNGLPPAFEEHPVLRNAYVRAFVNAGFRGATHTQTADFLDAIHATISSLLPHMHDTGLEDELDGMARTLRTVENRLGVNPDKSITYYFLCPDCWMLYDPGQLYELADAECIAEDCTGALFSVKEAAGRTVRTPTRLYPYHSLQTALRRFLLRPGIYEALQHWRGPDDQPGNVPPMTHEEWEAKVDRTRPATDIYDGWGWRSLRAHCVRVWDVHGRRVFDDSPVNQRFVALEMGLVFHINIDW